MQVRKIHLYAFLLCLGTHAYSQVINNVNYKVVDEKVFVTYDLVSESHTRYNITLKFVDEKGDVIIPKTIKGDLTNVTGGTQKEIIWYVTNDIKDFEGKYKAVLTIVKKIQSRHSLFYDADVPLTFAGIRYTYLGKFGGYVSVSTDFGAIDEFLICTAGLTMRIADKFYPYIGGGLEVFYFEPVPEAGFVINIKNMVIDLGFGMIIHYYDATYGFNNYNEELELLPFGKVGIGFIF